MPRPSSIDQLPPDIREALHALLRDPRVTQLDACQRVNALLKQEGIDQKLSKSAVNRYSQRYENVREKLVQSREVSQMLVGSLGNQPQGEIGKLLNEVIRTMAYETTMTFIDSEETVSPKIIKELSLAIKHLEDAASVNERREREIRKQVALDAANSAEKVAKAAGFTQESIDEIRADILGLTQGGQP